MTVVEDAGDGPDAWVLRLYIAGETPKSLQAIRNLEAICKERLDGRYHIEVIDLLKQPHLAADHQIIAVPTLVRHLPPPVHKVIGDLSSKEKVLVGLDLVPEV